MVFYRKVFAMQKQCNPEVGTWAFQLLKNINRFAQSGVSIERFPKKLGVVWLCFPSAWPCLLTNILLSKYGAAHPSWFLFNCALPKLYKFTRFLDLRAFAGFCGRFADFCGRFAGNVGQLCAFICVGARDMRMAWYVFGTQPGCKPCSVIIIQNVNCGDSVATRKQNQAN